jgi:LPXTG-site transpeptidase (sortase) family protein
MPIVNSKAEFIKICAFLATVLVVILQWNTVSWIFNYQAVSGAMHDFFNPYPESPLLVSADQIKLTNQVLVEGSQSKPVAPAKQYPYAAQDNSLEIPSIGITVPIVIGENNDIKTLENDLNRGVVYYPGSVLPGDEGQIVILGHSAPPGWPHIKFDWAFSEVEKLIAGQKIIVHFNHKTYTYAVKGTMIVKRGEDVSNVGLTGKNNILTIVSCWPPGKDYQRIAVSAELQT